MSVRVTLEEMAGVAPFEESVRKFLHGQGETFFLACQANNIALIDEKRTNKQFTHEVKAMRV